MIARKPKQTMIITNTGITIDPDDDIAKIIKHAGNVEIIYEDGHIEYYEKIYKY